MPGRLFLCATPIGNLGDASSRLAATLAEVDLVFAEDTRRSGRLLVALGVEAELRSFFVGNERRRSVDLAGALESGLDVALITDAGTPGLSDPGPLAVAAAREVGAEVVVIPGPSAVTAVVAGSGMVDGRFAFEGFLPRSGRERQQRLANLAGEERPVVVFLSPHRVLDDLADLAAACGPDREVCIGREMTKLHEELWWGTLGGALDRWREELPRGEFAMVVAGAGKSAPDLDVAVGLAARLVAEGLTPSQAARQAAAETGASRRQIYERLVN